MVLDFIILPKTIVGLVFGENYFPFSDSGYIQTINAVGLLGLSISFYFYFKIFFTLKVKNLSNHLKLNVSKALKMIILITLFVCIKNQYMFTRGSFELIILLFVIVNLPTKKVTRINSNV
jgi:hypothetical protein